MPYLKKRSFSFTISSRLLKAERWWPAGLKKSFLILKPQTTGSWDRFGHFLSLYPEDYVLISNDFFLKLYFANDLSGHTCSTCVGHQGAAVLARAQRKYCPLLFFRLLTDVFHCWICSSLDSNEHQDCFECWSNVLWSWFVFFSQGSVQEAWQAHQKLKSVLMSESFG